MLLQDLLFWIVYRSPLNQIIIPCTKSSGVLYLFDNFSMVYVKEKMYNKNPGKGENFSVKINNWIVQPWWLGSLARYLSHSVEEVHLAIVGFGDLLIQVLSISTIV